MNDDVLNSVMKELIRLREEVPGPKERRFAEVPKGRDTCIVVTVVPPDNLNALPSVDVREHVANARYTGPTKKGVRFSWKKLAECIDILEEQAQQLGEVKESWSVDSKEDRPEEIKAS